jgi:hypothetical protein
VVVIVEVRVVADALLARADRLDEPEIVEQPQRPIDRVERHRRHPPLDRPKHRVRVGVSLARRKLSEDLQALVSDLDARFAECLLEAPYPALDFLAAHV